MDIKSEYELFKTTIKTFNSALAVNGYDVAAIKKTLIWCMKNMLEKNGYEVIKK